MIKNLNDAVTIETAHFARVKKDADVFRVIVNFNSNGDLIKEYYVWLTDIFTEDRLRLKRSAEQSDYEKIALDLAEESFIKNNRSVPVETGLDASNKRGVQKVEHAKGCIHPVEQQ